MEAPALKLIILALAICSCMAIVRGAPDAVGSRAMEFQEDAKNSTSTKQLFRASTDTLNGEERGLFDFIRSILSLKRDDIPYQNLREHLMQDTFVPPSFKSLDENYLGTSEFAKRARLFLKSGEGHDTIMTGMRELHGDIVVANIIAIGMRNPKTKDLAFRLGDSQIRQWIRENREPEAVFERLELNKRNSIFYVIEDPLFNTWAEFVLKKERLQQNEGLAAAAATLIPETVLVREKLNSLDKKMDRLDSMEEEAAYVHRNHKKTRQLSGFAFGILKADLRRTIDRIEKDFLRLRVKALKFADADGEAYRAMVEVLKNNKYNVVKLYAYKVSYHMEGISAASERPALI